MVTLAPRRGDLAPRAHPLGRFVFAQQVVPFGLALDRFGDAGLAGLNEFDVEGVTVGGRPLASAAPQAVRQPVREHFARAQFIEMSEEDRLTRPAYEELDAGVEFSSLAFEVPARAVRTGLTYETSYLDLSTGEIREDPTPATTTSGLGHDLLQRFGRYGAAGQATRRRTEQAATVRRTFRVGAPPVLAADRTTLEAVPLAGPATTAQLVLEQRIRRAASPAQVVESFELAGD
jgi:hypothetical protein